MGLKLHQRIDIWKKLLLDFGKKNRLINFRETKRSNVKIVEPSYDKIFDRIAVREESLSFPYSKKIVIDDEGEEVFESVIKGDIETNKTISELQKTLKALRYRANTSIEEQGINVLFLALGMLKWREKDESTDVLSSPIVLVPVKLTIESLTSPYVLSLHEDEIVVNPTLMQKLDNDYGIKLPEFDGTQDSISDYFNKCEFVIKNKGWSIERDTHLTNLSFLKINMYKDLERNEDRLSSHPIVSAIAGERESIAIPEGLNNYDHDKNDKPINVFQVVDADASQQDAILLSKKGVSFVLQGPPGTGKSQTITNIISEALADGKKVLFVSEKMAALQVVYKRLSNVGLADFCFTLHSHKANKKEILRELASSISVDRKRVREEALAQLDLFEKKRQSLNEYQEQLHTPCSALNLTIYEVNGKLSKLCDVPDLVFPIPDVDKTTIQELNERKYLLNELSKTIGKRSEDYDNNVWKDASVQYLSNELRHDIDSNVAKLTPLLLSLDNIISKCNSDLEIDFEHTLAGRDKMFDLLSFLKKSCIIPQNWIFDVTESLIQKAKEYKKDTDVIKNHYQDIIKIFDSDIFSIDSKRESEILKKCKTNIFSVFSCEDGKELINNIELINGKLLSYSVLFKNLFSQAESLSNKINNRKPNNVSELKRFESLLNSLLLIKNITPTKAWFNSESFKDLLNQLPEFKLLHEKYVSLLDRCLNNYDEEILSLDYYPILQRFRSEYDSIFRLFNKHYRYDLNLIRGYSRGSEKLSYKTALDVLNQLKDIHETKEKVNHINEICKEYYGIYYHGLETKWDDLKNNIILFGNSISSVGHIPVNIQNRIINGDLPFDVINQYVDLVKSSNIDEVLSDISSYLLICDNDSYNEINRIFERSIKVSDEYLSQYNKLLSYRKDKKASCTDLLLDLEIVISYQEALYSIDAQKESIEKMYGFYYKGVDETDWTHLIDTLYYTIDLKTYIEKYSLPDELVKRICTDSNIADYCNVAYEALADLKEPVDEGLKWFADLFEGKDKFRSFYLGDLSDYLVLCKDNKHLLEEWIDYQSNRKRCAEAGLSPYLEQIDKALIDKNYIVDAYFKRFYRLWLDQILPHFPAVRDFRSRIHEQIIHEFDILDKEQFKIAQARVRERLISHIPDFNAITTSRDEIGILKRELNKQRRIMPLRKLFMAIPNLLSTLRPCFMMSPLSVSVFLEAKSYEFDLVVFDEASQVHTEDAIGAIMRGKQIIIVGDTKQLPPTSFFATSLNDEDFDVDDDEAKDSDAGAYESILDEAVTVLPERSLLWHYRSRDEHLIAFSNIKIYNRSLITFPSATEKAPDLGVEYVFVSDGVYDRGGKKNNMIEAKRVAQLVFEHFKKHPDKSLGVVTFSEAQQNAVDAAIRQVRLNNSAYEHFFADNVEEPFFIKNLENVQGDERDTIIFSIGYAKDNHGIMYMNFGPLSREGGYRRLNVAITRAKYNVKLVGSIQATDIDLDKTSAEGVKLLRSYIEYAQQGISALDKELDYNYDLVFDSPFEESVYNFLSSRGYEVVTQVGCSGFRIDMAIKHPTQKGKFAIGIECDGATYHSSRTARERDRLRQTVLEDMGWTLYRIWSTDWIKNQKSEEEKLLKAIDAALLDIREEKPVDSLLEQADNVLDIEIEEEKNTNDSKNNQYGFDFYKPSDLYSFWEYDPIEKIRKIIEEQQPIHFEALCKIIAPLWGNQKATNVIRNNVRFVFSYKMRDVVITKGDFVMLSDFKDLKVRIPEDTQEIRPIEYISEDELALAMKTIVRHSFGITPDGLITETARVYGFKRTGGKISASLKKVYDLLVLDNKIKEIDGKVNVVCS